MNELKKYFSEDWCEALESADPNVWLLLASISKKVLSERAHSPVEPPLGSPLMLKIFRDLPFYKTNVVIIGQDPYPQPGVFIGHAFGNNPTTKTISPSLVNIIAEVRAEYGEDACKDISLTSWVQQGVLLLNVAHTVVRNKPGTHTKLWEPFTRIVTRALNTKPMLVWMLWGNYAQSVTPVIINLGHLCLKASHPSPLGYDKTSTPFKGCGHFRACNEYLSACNKKEIEW